MKIKRGIIILLIFVVNLILTANVYAHDDINFDYSSFIGEWHKIDPDDLNGDVELQIIEVTDNNKIRFSIDGGEEKTGMIINNQVKWTEHWWDGEMGLSMSFYDDHIYLQYSRYSQEWYTEIVFVSSTAKPQRIKSSEYLVVLDGKELVFDQPPIMVSDRVLVPLRMIFEELGSMVEWDDNTQTVTATNGKTKLTISIGSFEMYKNDELITLDVEPQLVNDRTLVPVRAVAEGFGCLVDWIDEKNTVVITSSNQ